VLDTKTRPPQQSEGAEDPASQRPEPASRDRRHFLRLDVAIGLVTGFAVALVFGGSTLSTLGVFWRDVIVPAFYTLAQTGLAYCGF
jgi:hypothetical protein